MNFIWDKITEWLKELLVSGVVGNLSGLFDSINSQVSDVAGTVGASPQAWNGSIFGMIRSLSENVMVPIAGIILTFVMCLELIQMLIDRNNMHDFDTFMRIVFEDDTYATFGEIDLDDILCLELIPGDEEGDYTLLVTR